MRVAFWAMFAVAVVALTAAIFGFNAYLGDGAMGASVHILGVHGVWIGTDLRVGGIY